MGNNGFGQDDLEDEFPSFGGFGGFGMDDELILEMPEPKSKTNDDDGNSAKNATKTTQYEEMDDEYWMRQLRITNTDEKYTFEEEQVGDDTEAKARIQEFAGVLSADGQQSGEYAFEEVVEEEIHPVNTESKYGFEDMPEITDIDVILDEKRASKGYIILCEPIEEYVELEDSEYVFEDMPDVSYADLLRENNYDYSAYIEEVRIVED